MHSSDIIKSTIRYIEQNLKTTITAEELAEIAGYSVWHFHRLFAGEVGVSLASYISKRRLDSALGEIATGRRAVDVAFEYGYDTYAGFYKAFVREYKKSPKQYLSKKEVSTMFTDNELREILSHWDTPQDLPILPVSIMDGAAISDNVWAIGEEYVLKTENVEYVKQNNKLVKALARQNFTAAVPIPTKSGADYLTYKARAFGKNSSAREAPFILMHGLKGTPLPGEERFGSRRQEYGVKYGIGIGRLHSVLAEIEGEIQPYEEDLFQRVLEWALPESKKQNIQWSMGLPESFFEDYLRQSEFLFPKLPRQLIHRDPNPSNILFHGGELSSFVDFDISRRNVRLWDPCYCATGLLGEWMALGGKPDGWFDILASIMEGYNQVQPLTSEERQAVYYVICAIQMIFMAYLEPIVELKEMAKTNREMTMYIVGNEEKIKGLFQLDVNTGPSDLKGASR